MTNTEKTRENRLRHAAQRRGLVLQKSRTRDTGARGYGLYMLTSTTNDEMIAGDVEVGFGLTLDEVEDFLYQGRSVAEARRNSRQPDTTERYAHLERSGPTTMKVRYV